MKRQARTQLPPHRAGEIQYLVLLINSTKPSIPKKSETYRILIAQPVQYVKRNHKPEYYKIYSKNIQHCCFYFFYHYLLPGKDTLSLSKNYLSSLHRIYNFLIVTQNLKKDNRAHFPPQEIVYDVAVLHPYELLPVNRKYYVALL